jgi:hypothetical protein
MSGERICEMSDEPIVLGDEEFGGGVADYVVFDLFF